MNKLIILLILLLPKFLFSELNQEVRNFMERIDQTIYAGKIDSARILLIQFSSKFSIKKDKKYGAIINSFKSDIERASGNLDLALKYMIQSLQYKDYLGESSWYIYHKVANIYFEKKEYSKAKIYADSSMNYGNNPALIDRKKNMNYRILGYYYLDKKEFTKAENYYKEILEINKELDCEKALIYINLFTINLNKKEFSKAKTNLDSAEIIAKNTYCNAYQYLAMAYGKRVILAEFQSDYKSAFSYLKKQKNLLDSINIEERIRINKEIEKKYESKLIKSKNKALTQKNEEIEKRNRLFIILIIISIFAFLIILIVLILLRKKNTMIKVSKEKVDKLNELHQKIFNVISHDFNGSFLTLQFLLDDFNQINYSQVDFLAKINEVQSYLNQSNYVLQNLTNWAKIELNDTFTLQQKYAVKDLLEKVKTQLEFQLKAKRITFENNIEKDLKTEIPADYLAIVFRNLINNAIKFSYKDSKITVSNRDQTIHIQDFGKGIKNEKLSQLFKTKVEPETGTENELGFGIGLKIVHEIVEKFKGEIELKSNENKGTLVLIKIKKT